MTYFSANATTGTLSFLGAPFIGEFPTLSAGEEHENIPAAPLTPLAHVVDVMLPAQIENLDQAVIFPLHRHIERQYRSLPWPAQMQRIAVITEIAGGRGDIAAGAKAIAVMQRLSPLLTFDWFVSGWSERYPLESFLHCDDPSKVHIHPLSSYMRLGKDLSNGDLLGEPPVDFLLTGPVEIEMDIDEMEKGILSRKLAGPILCFTEIALESTRPEWQINRGLDRYRLPHLLRKIKSDSQEAALPEVYQSLHSSLLFPSQSDVSTRSGIGFLPMDLESGSGVFLDQGRIEAPLSREYCCPSYLLQIQDEKLRRDILETMNVFDGQSKPDYDQYSMNFGYAHRPVSWEKFIDAVAIHEKNKHVVIVLNHRGEYDCLSTQEFQDQIFTRERLAFLKQKGYGTVILKGEGQEAVPLQEADDPQSRRLTVIVRPFFASNDMRSLQLASERLLGTGDNSAVESLNARCKLYLYEDVDNGGIKWKFLQQQVDLAQTISPNLSRLLALFGGDRRLPDSSLIRPLRREKMAEMERILNDPGLSSATLEFCNHVNENYSFAKVLEGAIKRAAWHHYIPELSKIEAETLDEEFRIGIVSYLRSLKVTEKNLRIRNMLELGKRVQETVQKYLATSN